ncbi:MAG TPA: DegV family protein [bacterium]|nr:DegV family protein [bacterium]HNT65729.1 DegV family protein [bacterium]
MKIKIKYIDGVRLKRSIIASANRVHQMQTQLNDINVFPVADGDTGTNMASTMQSIARGAEACQSNSIDQISSAIADSALDGARGNSGAILAQFFQGLAEELRGKWRINAHSLAVAANVAVERARDAISNPREGTILTVMKDWAVHLNERASSTTDIAELLHGSLAKAKESLLQTPEKLKVLKKAGVVDAGAQGFVHLLEGIVHFMDTGKINMMMAGSQIAQAVKSFHLGKVDDPISYGYCTECLIEGQKIDRKKLRQQLASLGDSLIVVGTPRKVRIHIHTNDPKTVVATAKTYGTLLTSKIDDMRKQHRNIIADHHVQEIALVTDSTCDLSAEFIEKHNIYIVPVILQIDDQSYQDRIEMKPADFYRILQTTQSRLTTSQPPAGAFKNLYDKIAPHYSTVLSIHISEQLSGTISAARSGMARQPYADRVRIIDSRTTSAALGMLVAEAAEWIEKNKPVDEIVAHIEEFRANIRFFVSIPTLKYLLRSGRLTRKKALLGTLLHLKPIITLSPEGKIMEAAKVIGQKNLNKKTLQLALDHAHTLHAPRFSVVHALAPELANWYCEQIRLHFDVKEIMVTDASPALGVHAGIGSAAIAVAGSPR